MYIMIRKTPENRDLDRLLRLGRYNRRALW
jgi:hypothetical protein